MLSRLHESEPSMETSGRIEAMSSGSLSEANFEALAVDQLRLPVIVLISPLCAR